MFQSTSKNLLGRRFAPVGAQTVRTFATRQSVLAAVAVSPTSSFFGKSNNSYSNGNPTTRFTNLNKAANTNPVRYFSQSHHVGQIVDEVVVDEQAAKLDETASSLDTYNISEKTKNQLLKHGITKLFPIQSACYKHIYSGKDLIARARTGTGKTMSFALPVIERMIEAGEKGGRGLGPVCIIIAPTRELAIQVQREVEKIAPQFNPTCLYGGASISEQVNKLRMGASIVIGTPGRTKDLIERGSLNMSRMEFLVLDEADRMLDQGFSDELDYIAEQSKSRGNELQMALFSATVPAWVKQVARKYMKRDYAFVDLVGTDAVKTSELITHQAMRVESLGDSHEISKLIKEVLQSRANTRAIVFVNMKREANDLCHSIKHSAALHGDVSQSSREHALQQFRNGSLKVLIATDVAARGLDIDGVELVIQIGIPVHEMETYIHRSGRTGRAGKKGTCITLFDNYEDIYKVQTFIKQNIQVMAPPSKDQASSSLLKLSVDLIEQANPLEVKRFIPYATKMLEILNSKKDAAKSTESQNIEIVASLLSKALKSIDNNATLAVRSALTGEKNMVTMITEKGSNIITDFCRSNGIKLDSAYVTKDRTQFVFDIDSQAVESIVNHFGPESVRKIVDQVPDYELFDSRFRGNRGYGTYQEQYNSRAAGRPVRKGQSYGGGGQKFGSGNRVRELYRSSNRSDIEKYTGNFNSNGRDGSSASDSNKRSGGSSRGGDLSWDEW